MLMLSSIVVILGWFCLVDVCSSETLTLGSGGPVLSNINGQLHVTGGIVEQESDPCPGIELLTTVSVDVDIAVIKVKNNYGRELYLVEDANTAQVYGSYFKSFHESAQLHLGHGVVMPLVAYTDSEASCGFNTVSEHVTFDIGSVVDQLESRVTAVEGQIYSPNMIIQRQVYQSYDDIQTDSLTYVPTDIQFDMAVSEIGNRLHLHCSGSQGYFVGSENANPRALHVTLMRDNTYNLANIGGWDDLVYVTLGGTAGMGFPVTIDQVFLPDDTNIHNYRIYFRDREGGGAYLHNAAGSFVCMLDELATL